MKMENPFVSGVYTALVTPFTANGDHVNLKILERLIVRQAEAGVQGVVVLGTTGESPTVLDWERDNIIRCAVRVKKEQGLDLNIIAGCGTNSTHKTFHYSHSAMQMGADGVLLVNPYYNKPSQEGLYQHFSHVAQRGLMPIMLYNIPGRTGVNLETETLIRLVKDCPSIYAIKEASGNEAHIRDVIEYSRREREDFGVFSGDDAMTPFVLNNGGNGVVSVVSNVVPEDVALQHRTYGCEVDEFHEVTLKLEPLISACFVEGNPSSVKYIVNRLGFDCGPMRLPLVTPGSANQQKIDDVLRGYGLIQ